MRFHSSIGESVPPAVTRFTTLLALAVSVLVSILPPTLHFYYAMQYIEGHEAAEAESNARLVTQLVGENPSMWEFETLRLEWIIDADEDDEKKEILNSSGDVVALAGNEALGRPTVTSTAPIFDSGVVIGKVAITRSLRDTALASSLIFLVSLSLASAAFFVLKTLPLRLLRNATDRASFLASHDPLTGLPNRSLFNEWLEHTIREVDREKGYMAVLYLDLDHFKEVNDIHGHGAGDELLRQVTERMTGTLRTNDILARLGGDEFAVLQKNFEESDAPRQLAERLIDELSQPFDLQGVEILIGVSIGISSCNNSGDRNGQELLRQADLALYRAKSDGRGTFRYFEDEMNDKLVARKRMEADLRQAIFRNELQLHYQPQIDLQNNTIKGMEALLRWYHRDHGVIMPDEYIPLAEETGLIIPIGDWVIREACKQAKAWPQLSIAVNVSPVQFRQGDLVETVRSALLEEGVEPHRLELEITEGVLLKHTDETIDTLKALQTVGVKIVMDDFGTGYSSLSYLRRFPFDKIKIDKSFTHDLGKSDDANNIIDAVIKLGSSMGMTSNAEGVETVEQANFLRMQGCKEVQGFFYSKAVPSSSIGELLAEWDKSRESFEFDLKAVV